MPSGMPSSSGAPSSSPSNAPSHSSEPSKTPSTAPSLQPSTEVDGLLLEIAEQDAVIETLCEIADLVSNHVVPESSDGESLTTAPGDEETTTTTGSTGSTTGSTLPGRADESSDDEIPAGGREADALFTSNETQGMTKRKTIYVYRKEDKLKKAVKANMPLSGIVHVSQSPTRFELQLVYRHPVNMFGRKRVQFQDDEGIWFHGMWCAKLVVEEESTVESTEAFSEIQSDASLSAVAIPLWYILGKEHPHANYYWVTTNWWKHRMDDGAYRLIRFLK